ncbi:YihY/virulence factor BrkB family protein [Deinococcus maricopensis]|uniref:YihY/virulence factor BrkB family protein n=1 Tax=Deinococcus maricopensis TaxID=309887 RepID=UPI00030BF8BD|nr:YihY/virulence factor BrkB family protein [Deinococcus maricopensis]
MKAKDLLPVLRDAFMAFGQDRAPRLAAAFAYYTMFSLAPLLFFLLAIAGYFLGQSAFQEQLFGANGHSGLLAQYFDAKTADFVKGLLASDNNQLSKGSGIATLVGFVTLFMGATGLFVQLQDALNSLWGADPAPRGGILQVIRTRLVSFAMVVLFGALIIAFLGVNTYLSAIAGRLGDVIGAGAFFVRLATLLLSAGMFTLAFAAMYRFLPSIRLSWRDVWVGAAVTAVLFAVGQTLISVYFARVSPGSVFGAAGSLVVLLLWIYYSGMIVFFGAEVTWAYAQRFGSQPGGAQNPDKKAALANKGSDLNPNASPREQQEAARTPEAGGQAGQAAPKRRGFPRLPRRQRPKAPPRPREAVPSITAALTNAVLAVLAVPAVLALRVARRFRLR